jgi:hypothetical protein
MQPKIAKFGPRNEVIKSSITSTELLPYIDGGQLLRSWHEQKNVVQVYLDSGRSTSEFGFKSFATDHAAAALICVGCAVFAFRLGLQMQASGCYAAC